MPQYVKRRAHPVPGSIPDVLDMFRCELRFYREIAPVAGVRVPACHRAEETGDGTLLVLEDLSAWSPGADPAAAARLLCSMHRRWEGTAATRWPWLRRAGAGSDLVERLFAQTWPALAASPELPASLVAFGESVNGRIAELERATRSAGPVTLIHGDASAQNMRTGPAGEVALLDWEDVSAAPGVLDLAWLLISSVTPASWDEVITAYAPPHVPAPPNDPGRPDGPSPPHVPAPPDGPGSAIGLAAVLPAVMVQGLLSLSDTSEGSAEATAWIARLTEAHRRLTADPGPANT